jgi:hypothetical protein
MDRRIKYGTQKNKVTVRKPKIKFHDFVIDDFLDVTPEAQATKTKKKIDK